MKLSDSNRREFAAHLAKTLLGVSSFGALPHNVFAQTSQPLADNCILLMMAGGMSHLDTFDPKPEHPSVMGKTEVQKSAITGEPFSTNIPNLAKLAGKLAVVRSMFQETADHRQATYLMRTSYSMRPSIVHPSLGPWAQKLLGKRQATLPDSVTIGAGSDHPGQGFLAPEFSPLPIGAAQNGIPNMTAFGTTNMAENSLDETLNRRLELANKLDQAFRERVNHQKVRAYTQFYDETLKFLKSDDLKLFDLSEENPEQRDRYGTTSFGQGCLLAKRLVKGGVRFVEVQHSSWDTHVDNFEQTPRLASVLDRAASNLIQDLDSEGLLNRTLVIIATEFGRTPTINANSGRDHHAQAYSCVLAGGGVRGGQIIGKSDARGQTIETEKYEPKHLNATLAHALGLDLNEIVFSPSGRPFTVATHKSRGNQFVSGAEPIMKVFS